MGKNKAFSWVTYEPVLFVEGLGLALAAKACPYLLQAFKKVNTWYGQAFPTFLFLFSERADCRYLHVCSKTSTQLFEDLTA